MDDAPAPRPPRRAEERGVAMLLVLLLTSIAIVIVAELAYQSGLELLSASNVSDIGAIEYAIDGQFEVVLSTLRYDERQNEVDTEDDLWNEGDVRSRRDGDVALSTRVFDEQSKFNVMRLVTGNDAQKKRAREVFVRLLDLFRDGITEDKTKGGDLDLADAEDVADRVIKHLKREGASGQVPKPKTLPADVPLLLDELLFVDTQDNRLMHGLLRDVQVKDVTAPGLHRYLTCYGTSKINLNTAPVKLLQALFSNVQDRDYAQGIVDRRQGASASTTPGTGSAMSGTSAGTSTTEDTEGGNPFTDVNQVTDGSVQGLTAEVLQRNGIDPAAEFDVKSDFFSVRIQGATTRTQRDELYVVERVKGKGFRHLLHQERTDPLLETTEDQPTTAR